MAKFSKENQPPGERKSAPRFRTLMLNALKERGIDEQGFVRELVIRALEPGLQQGTYLSELLKRYAPVPKSTFETVIISGFDESGTPLQKSEAVYNAMAAGEIPPDVGQIFIESISKLLVIEEMTELKERIKKLEDILNK